jgi:Mg-chelatase subunit ChlD
VSLLEPGWLALAVPAALVVWWWRPPTRTLVLLRALLLLLVVAAMVRPVVLNPAAGGAVVVVADRSRSMPADSERLQTEIIDRLTSSMGRDDRVAVVSFADRAAIEAPLQHQRFSGFSAPVNDERSNLLAGLQLALSLLPVDAPGRLLVLSDGRWTGEEPSSAAGLAAARGVAIDALVMQRDQAGDLVIDRIETPAVVAAGESFMISAWLRSPTGQQVSYRLRRGDLVLAQGSRALASGRGRLLFRDRAGSAGTMEYTLEVTGTAPDPVPESNRGRALVTAVGRPRLLHVSSRNDSGLTRLLSEAGIDVSVMAPAEVDWSLANLASHTAVVLENVPAAQVGTAGMANLAAWVRSGAGGLLVTGGASSYATGGYFRSPLDPLLPVSMELRREHRKLALAVVVAMDRSGSMAAPVAGGRSKMDLANLAAAEVVGVLTPMDELGVVAVDSAAHIVAPLQRLEHPAPVRSRILSIDSLGGGIFVYEALSTAAGMLAESEAGTRHILLFADAADAEEPGDYRRLLGHCRDAGISVSVIGLGQATDSDADLLRDIAVRGDGRCYFTDDPHELPRLFAQDTFVVARSTLIEEKTKLTTSPGLLALTGSLPGEPPEIGGYNLCYLRPGAIAGLITIDQYQAPIVAAWHVESGRVACYTGEAEGPLTGDMATWPQATDLFAGLARWVMAIDTALPPEMLVTQEVERGALQVRLHLDPERDVAMLPGTTQVRVAQALPGRAPQVEEQELHWLTADTMGADIVMAGDGATVATVHIKGVGKTALAPVCLPYSPEFAESGSGTEALVRLARVTGGRQRLRPETIWDEIVRTPRPRELASLLYLLAVTLLLTEVLERRTSVLSRLLQSLQWKVLELQEAKAHQVEAAVKGETATHQVRPEAGQQPVTKQGESPEPPVEPGRDLIDALSKARSRARKRTGSGED